MNCGDGIGLCWVFLKWGGGQVENFLFRESWAFMYSQIQEGCEGSR